MTNYWQAETPKGKELKKLAKQTEKYQKDVEILRQKQALDEEIRQRKKEIKALKWQQSKIGKVTSRFREGAEFVKKDLQSPKAKRERKSFMKDLLKSYNKVASG